MKTPFQVLYITGCTHSGSTLLDLCLGSHSRVESLGEFINFQRAYKNGEHCSCGESILCCPLWEAVRKHLQAKGILLESLDPRAEDLESFKSANLQLLRTIQSLTGKSIFVDSSKSIKRLRRYLDCGLPEFNIKVIHLLRHPLAGLESQRKNRKRGRTILTEWKMRHQRILALIQRYRKTVPFITLRYEDFSANPERWLKELNQKIGIPFEESQLKYYDKVHHIPAGNRLRLFLSDRRPIVPDMAWTKKSES